MSDSNVLEACSTPDCNGDARYAAPGRGHRPGCHHPLPAHSCGYPEGSFACKIRHIQLNTGDAKAAKD